VVVEELLSELEAGAALTSLESVPVPAELTAAIL
jgi:hypothetical protein